MLTTDTSAVIITLTGSNSERTRRTQYKTWVELHFGLYFKLFTYTKALSALLYMFVKYPFFFYHKSLSNGKRYIYKRTIEDIFYKVVADNSEWFEFTIEFRQKIDSIEWSVCGSYFKLRLVYLKISNHLQQLKKWNITACLCSITCLMCSRQSHL